MAELRRRFAGCMCKLQQSLRKFIAGVGLWINNPDLMVGLYSLLGHCESIVPHGHLVMYVILFLRVVVVVWLVAMWIRSSINRDKALGKEVKMKKSSKRMIIWLVLELIDKFFA